jgi:hypothetical protein
MTPHVGVRDHPHYLYDGRYDHSGKSWTIIGAWGMANAISHLMGSVLGGMARDLIARLTQDAVLGFVIVFGVMAAFMLISLVMLTRINVGAFFNPKNNHPWSNERL